MGVPRLWLELKSLFASQMVFKLLELLCHISSKRVTYDMTAPIRSPVAYILCRIGANRVTRPTTTNQVVSTRTVRPGKDGDSNAGAKWCRHWRFAIARIE